VKCAFAVYADTYDAVAEAVGHDEQDAVREHCAAAWSLDAVDAFAAGAAIADALQRAPRRASIQVCRLCLEEPCGALLCEHVVG
jgi:hypothetical protein